MHLCVLVLVLAGVHSLQTPTQPLVLRVFKECLDSNNRLSCFSTKAAKTLEKAMDRDIHFFDGVSLVRTDATVEQNDARSPPTGLARFTKALADFLDTHAISLDLTEDEARQVGGGGFGGVAFKRERRYMRYAFMVLLGIFGLVGPLVMKTLAVMAAKALIASKMALIIVGSVALKKIFDKDHEKPAVKVHTVHAEDDHERIYNPHKTAPYWYHDPYAKPA